MKKIAFVSMFLLAMSFAAGAQAYTITNYTSYSAFLAAISPTSPLVENFQDAILEPGFSINEIGGSGVIHDGVYENVVYVGEPRYQVFNYAPGMFAFGGWFDLQPGGPGSGINMYINDDNTFVISIPSTAEGQFYGFVADGTFTGVRLEDALGVGGFQETYYAIDVAMAPVPIPGAAWLLGSGLLGLVAIRRRFKK
jgi:hypothetical protein